MAKKKKRQMRARGAGSNGAPAEPETELEPGTEVSQVSGAADLAGHADAEATADDGAGDGHGDGDVMPDVEVAAVDVAAVDVAAVDGEQGEDAVVVADGSSESDGLEAAQADGEVSVETLADASSEAVDLADDGNAVSAELSAEATAALTAEAAADLTGDPEAGEEAVAEDGTSLPNRVAAALPDRDLKALIEALIFASDKPLTLQRMRQLTRVADADRLARLVRELGEETRDRGIVLTTVSGGYQFRTHSVYSAWVQQLIAGRPVKLSRAQLESLAIIAYRQPITRPEIDDIRGVDSGATLKLLLDRQLIRVLGKREEPGRPILYGTTKEFLDFFSLQDLRELPTLREYSELTDESRETARKLGVDLQTHTTVIADAAPEGEPVTEPAPAPEGEALEGEALEGEALEGEALEGAALEGEALEGEALEGEALEGEALDAAAPAGDAEADGQPGAEVEPDPGVESAMEFAAEPEAETVAEPEDEVAAEADASTDSAIAADEAGEPETVEAAAELADVAEAAAWLAHTEADRVAETEEVTAAEIEADLATLEPDVVVDATDGTDEAGDPLWMRAAERDELIDADRDTEDYS